jgi:outer membrane protein assembly factor BamB
MTTMFVLKKISVCIMVCVLITSVVTCQKQISHSSSPSESFFTYRGDFTRRGVVSIPGYQPNSSYALGTEGVYRGPRPVLTDYVKGSTDNLCDSGFSGFYDPMGCLQIPSPIVYKDIIIHPTLNGKITFTDTSQKKDSPYGIKPTYILDVKLPIQGTPTFVYPFLYYGSSVSNQPNFFCFNWTTKEIEWSVQVEGGVFSSPIVTNDSVFVLTRNALYSLDKNNGDSIWVRMPEKGRVVFSEISYDGDYLYYMDFEDTVLIHALDSANGKEIWSYEYKYQNMQYNSPIMLEDDFVVVSHQNSIIVLNASTGALYWEIPIRKYLSLTEVCDNMVLWKGKIYVGEISTISMWDLYTKKMTHKFKFAETNFRIKTLFLNSDENALYCTGHRDRSEDGWVSNKGVYYIAKISLDEEKMIWEIDFRSPHEIDLALNIVLFKSHIIASETVYGEKITEEDWGWSDRIIVYK